MDAVVKIDSELKKKAEALVKEKRFDYPNLKNFVDKAILMLLEKEGIKNKKTIKVGKRGKNNEN
ncbi:MAG: hypothetical protein ABIE22_04490 [archaeon]